MEESKSLTTVKEAVKKENPYVPSIWNDSELMAQAWKAANFLADSNLVPQNYQKKPHDTLIALDIANRTGMNPLNVMQNLYVVKGKPSWSGQMCIGLVNNSKRFTPLEFVFVGDMGSVLGYFWAVNNFIRDNWDYSLRYSNESLSLYMNAVAAYDPASFNMDEDFQISTMAHEFLHMINFYQRVCGKVDP